MKSAPGTSSQNTGCGVDGCKVSSRNDPSASFFAVPTDPTRSAQWLKLMRRQDLIGLDQQVWVCCRHFYDHEIISTPTRNFLKKDVAPSLNLPANKTEDRFVQAQPWLFHSSTQTETTTNSQKYYANRKQTGVQVGLCLISELRRRRIFLDEYENCRQRLKEYESGSEEAYAEMFFRNCDLYLSKPLSELVKARVNVEGKKLTLNYKVFCLNLYHVSPRGYSLISEDFNLPSIGRLRQIDIPMSSAFNETIMDAFKIKVSNMTETEKYSSIAVDVMKIKSKLFYSAKQDKIIGFHEIDGVQKPLPARHAIVLVLKGIFSKWTQPIGYALLAEQRNHEDMLKWISKVLSKLIEIGLKVRTFVCTSKSKLVNESKIRSLSVVQPFFLVNGVKIYYVYDFPYMFRQVRNFFLTHDFHYGEGENKRIAKISDVKEFYESDKMKKLPIANKLRDHHLNPSAKEKRDTKYAAELLSSRVAMGMETYVNFKVMHEFARDTVYFLNMMSNLYEMFNSLLVFSDITYNDNKPEIEVLGNVLSFFRTLQIISKKTGKDSTNKVMFIKELQITITSVLLLLEELKQESFKYLSLKSLNLTVSENLFRRLKAKGKLTVKPTCQRFALMYRKTFLGHFLKGTKNTGIKDFTKLISKLHELSEHLGDDHCQGDSDNANAPDRLSQLPLKDVQEMAKFAEGIDNFRFCGILLRKSLEHHRDCEIFKYLVDSYETILELGADDSGMSQLAPITTEDLFAYVSAMEDKFREAFATTIVSKKIVHSIFQEFEKDLFLNSYAPCPCFPVEFLQNLFIRLRLSLTINYNNRLYRESEALNFSIPRI